MSGSGKSYWSKKLQAKGFKRFCCDDLIEKKLENELKKLGYSGIQDVAKWMGQPFDTQYLRSSKEYLNAIKSRVTRYCNIFDSSICKRRILTTNPYMRPVRLWMKVCYQQKSDKRKTGEKLPSQTSRSLTAFRL